MVPERSRLMIQYNPDPDLTKDIEALAAEIFPDPQAWLDAPHFMLGGETPRELIQKQPLHEQIVRDILRGMKHGISP